MKEEFMLPVQYEAVTAAYFLPLQLISAYMRKPFLLTEPQNSQLNDEYYNKTFQA